MTTEALEELDAGDGTVVVRRGERYGRQRSGAAAAAIADEAERIKRREVEEAIGKLEGRDDLGDGRRDAIEELADAIVDQLLAAPIGTLRQTTDRVTLHAALRLFGAECEVGDGRSTAGDRHPPEVDGGE